ncbi:MAG: GvpL/GvpF family gas vesicle protein [Chloroflexi bacterium]|nr:GvpL/GvpF family gas vesicle protein [Chloroflexota bacterium]
MSSAGDGPQALAGSSSAGCPAQDAADCPSSRVPKLGDPTEGCYVYCVGRAKEEGALGLTGIDGKKVRALGVGDLCALVHDGASKPYSSRDPKVVADWVLAHHHVVEAAWRRWGAVLPITFNTIIAGDGGKAHENLRRWLQDERERLEGRLHALHNLAEYGVQVFCDPGVIAREVADANPELHALRERAISGSRGAVYLSRRQLERALQRDSQVRISQEVEAFYRRVTSCMARVHVEPVKDAPGERPMVMNLACLVSREQYPGLEAELHQMSAREGFSVRLVGPLPPYSFC